VSRFRCQQLEWDCGLQGPHVSMGPATGVSEGLGATSWAGTAGTMCLGASNWKDLSE